MNKHTLEAANLINHIMSVMSLVDIFSESVLEEVVAYLEQTTGWEDEEKATINAIVRLIKTK